MLVGGMTFPTRPQEDERTLYLFLRASLQELRDDEKKPAPIAPARPKEEEVTEEKLNGE
ncbi:MAG TPA: hypothetical protein VKU82_10850 [Planctomycetaceae bacterium]|nr:hypothetical protein [Planctomycetaceae bacterium]